jgi:hypothetical protein
MREPEDDMPAAELDARARADAALRRIRAGSDPTREAFDLANTLNDESKASRVGSAPRAPAPPLSDERPRRRRRASDRDRRRATP